MPCRPVLPRRDADTAPPCAQVIEAKLPQRVSRLRRVEKRIDPYACLAIRPHECAFLPHAPALRPCSHSST